jgi:hypothetical protein
MVEDNSKISSVSGLMNIFVAQSDQSIINKTVSDTRNVEFL